MIVGTHHPGPQQNYNIVEDLSQALSAMSSLEVLKTCLAQRKALLDAIGVFQKYPSGFINFDTKNHKSRLPYHVMFQNKFSSKGTNIFRTIFDEGASTCVMSLLCWKVLNCPKPFPSNQLLKAFDGHTFTPQGVIPYFPVELGCQTISVEAEVVDTPIDYNLLLG